MKTKLQNFLAISSIILSGILWGSMGLFVRKLNTLGFTSMQIVELRSVFTSLILLIVFSIFKPSLLKIDIKDIWIFFGTGIMSILFFNWCYFSTISQMPLSFAVIMLYTAPVFVLLLSAILFKEKVTLIKIFALLLAFTGCVLVSISGKTGYTLNFPVILLGLGSGLGYALYSIFSRYGLIRKYKVFTIIFWTFFISSIGGAFFTDWPNLFANLFPKSLNAAAITDTGAFIGTVSQSTSNTHTDFSVLLFFLLYTLVSTIAPYILYTAGLTKIENSKASVFAFSEPLTATTIGLIFFNEIPSVKTVLGIILMLSSLILLNFEKNKLQ